MSDPVRTTRLSIRAATPDDVPLLLELIHELAVYEKLADRVEATGERLHRGLFGERPVAEALLGYAGDEVAAYAIFTRSFSSFLALPGIYLEDVYVRPTLRGGGIGRAMLAHLARLAVERGCGRLEWVVLDWNETAIRFYAGLGAEPMSDWITYRLSGEPLARLAGDSRSRSGA